MGFLDFFKKKNSSIVQEPEEEVWRMKDFKYTSPTPSISPATPKKAASSKPSANTITVRVVGTNYCDQTAICSLGTQNPYYELNKRSLIKKYPDGVDIYEYSFPNHRAQFEFETTNEQDPNAIKVLIKGVHVGYVKKGSCSRIKNLLYQGKIDYTTAEIYGGKAKFLTCMNAGDIEDRESTDYELEKDNSDFTITLTVHLMP